MSYGDGKVTRYKLKDGRVRYLVQVPDGHGKYLTAGVCDDPADIEKVRAAGLRARVTLPEGGTLAEYGETWLQRTSKQRGAKSWRSTWKHLIAPSELGRTLVGDIERRDIRDWWRGLFTLETSRGEPPSWQYRKHAFGLVRRCLAEAVEDELLEANPCIGFELDSKPDTEWTYLELDELRAVLALEGLAAQARAVFEWAPLTGLRQGELAALEWRDVDLPGRRMHVRRSWDRPATKNGRGRHVTLIPEAVAAVERWRSAHLSTFQALVFPNPAGSMWSKGYDWGWGDRRAGKDVPTRAGIKRRVTFHALRHTHASHLVSGSWSVGAWSLELVRDQLGHSSIEETERYAHLTPAARLKAGQSAIDRQSEADRLAEMLSRIEGQLAALTGDSKWRPRCDSNAGPFAPEAEATACDDAELARLLSIDCRFAAVEMQEAIAGGVAPSVAACRELAAATLAQDPIASAALAVLREPTARAVLELAELLAGSRAKAGAR